MTTNPLEGDRKMTREFVTRLVEFDIKEQAESDAFIRRIAACKSPEEIRTVVDCVRELLKSEGNFMNQSDPVEEK